jgi:hypothetical protein
MADYIKAEFEFLSNEQKEMIIALLTEMDYEGFEEEGDLLNAYIPSGLYNEDELRTLANNYKLSYTVTEIKIFTRSLSTIPFTILPGSPFGPIFITPLNMLNMKSSSPQR